MLFHLSIDARGPQHVVEALAERHLVCKARRSVALAEWQNLVA